MRILVVDDDSDTCRNMADLFGDLGYGIDTAEGGYRALEIAARRRFDVALLDLRMPGMDCLTLCRRLMGMQPSMVAVIVTACDGANCHEEARRVGARHVVRKPVDFSRLFALIDQARLPRDSFDTDNNLSTRHS